MALTASTAGDTIQLFNNSTAVVSANTILGLNGNDIINLGAEGHTASASAYVSGTLIQSGVFSTAVTGRYDLSASLRGADVTYSAHVSGAIYASGALSSFATGVSVGGVVTSENAVRRISQSQIFGNQDNDSIAFGSEIASISASTIGGGAGNDVIGTYSYVNQVWTGAQISAAAGFINNSLIEGGGGNDVIKIDTTGSITTATIQGAAGNDAIFIDAIAFEAAQMLGGGDSDFLTGAINTLSGSTIAGGGGNDYLVISAGTGGKTLIAGDVFNSSDSVYDGNDTIIFGASITASSVSVQGGGGNDSIVFSALGASSYLAGNLGNDTIFILTAFSASTVYGGAGNDSILISGNVLGSFIYGGGDKDTINFAGDVGVSASYSGSTVYGGLGADLFVASAMTVATTLGVTFGYSAYADSTISAMDSIAIGSTAISGAYVLDFVPAGLTLGSFSGSQAGIATGTNGIVTFTSTFDGDVSARYSVINTDMTTVGATVVFKDGSNVNYLFIQGGTSDDLIAQVGVTASGVAAISIVATRQITIDTV